MDKWNNKFRYQVASCWLFILSVVCMSLSPFVSFQLQFVTYLLTFPRIYRKHQLVLSWNCDACRKHQPFVSLDGVICRMYLQYISNIQQFKYSSFHQPHIGNTKFTESSVSELHNYKQSSTARGYICLFLKNNKE